MNPQHCLIFLQRPLENEDFTSLYLKIEGATEGLYARTHRSESPSAQLKLRANAGRQLAEGPYLMASR